MLSRVRLRRSPWIVSYWEEDQLVYENYLSRIRITAAPLTTVILDFFDRWRSVAGLIPQLAGFAPASIRREVARLCALSFLEETGRVDPRSQAMQAWADWSPEAAFFHFASKDVPFRKGIKSDLPAARKYAREHPQPPFFKHYPQASRIRLSREDLPAGQTSAGGGQSEFVRVLLERRTWRQFSPRKLPLATLGQLLYLTWGVMRSMDVELVGRLPLKTSPSGGARHPTEVYVVPLRVEGLPQGLYHYASDRHELECLRLRPMKRRAIQYLGEQWFFGEAAALFLMTAVFSRTLWKYKYSRAYRTILLDAGHLCQTLCLAATWLGLAPFCTAALADSLIERDIGADGISESAMYAAGVGVRPSARTDPGVPSTAVADWL